MPHALAPIALRLAAPADEHALADLAALDSARRPEGPLLVAEQAGELLAALSLITGTSIADPFHPTAHVIELLRVQARALTAASLPRRPTRGRRALRALVPVG